MFKIGFFSHGTGGGDVIPDPISNYTISHNTFSFSPYRYMAYQITGITVPITLRVINNLQAASGGNDAHVFYSVDPTWPYGNVLNDAFGAGPMLNYYATFTMSTGDDLITVNPNDWLILGVDGTYSTGGIGITDTSGTILNTSNGNALISHIYSTYQTP